MTNVTVTAGEYARLEIVDEPDDAVDISDLVVRMFSSPRHLAWDHLATTSQPDTAIERDDAGVGSGETFAVLDLSDDWRVERDGEELSARQIAFLVGEFILIALKNAVDTPETDES